MVGLAVTQVNVMNSMRTRSSGFSLIEVMIAVVVLAVGLISLAALQAKLFQAGAESKTRAAATAIAQQELEEARSFAFVTPPVNPDGTVTYAGATYVGLASLSNQQFSSGGVDYTVSRTVTRYVFDPATSKFKANSTSPYSLAVPEFKQVDVTVTWQAADGNRTIRLFDSIAAISPADAALLRKVPDGMAKGPKVYLKAPSDPYIMPIGLGDDQEAASSNPKPNQVIQDVAAATTFQVMTYTYGGSTDTVLLGRKLDVASVSCLCQANGNASREAPVYAPVLWSGRQQAYLPPKMLTDTAIPKGRLDSKLDNSEIRQMCTVCCRDHHESAKKAPRPDPWRVISDAEKTQEHYGYVTNGNQYKLGSLLRLGSTGVSSYVESCQLVRVDGQMRLAVDARQANLLVTPLSTSTTAPYDVVDFKRNYGDYVTQKIATDIGGTTGGGFPRFQIPADSNLRLANPLVMNDTSPEKRMAAFGLYMDYLTDDTIAVYRCIEGSLSSTDSRCSGLVQRNAAAAMAVLPFYAVNVANLGEWMSGVPEAIGVYSANFVNRTDGGRAYPAYASSAATIPVSLRMNMSNSGLASTLPVDPDDKNPASFGSDKQDFKREGGTAYRSYTVNFAVEEASSINLSGYNFVVKSGSKLVCQGRFSVSCTQPYSNNDKADDMVVSITGYNTTPDFKICLRNPEPLLNASIAGITDSDLAAESTQISISVKPNSDGSNPLNNLDHALNIYLAVVPQANSCPT